MALQIGDQAPNFTANTTEGEIDFHNWLGDIQPISHQFARLKLVELRILKVNLTKEMLRH